MLSKKAVKTLLVMTESKKHLERGRSYVFDFGLLGNGGLNSCQVWGIGWEFLIGEKNSLKYGWVNGDVVVLGPESARRSPAAWPPAGAAGPAPRGDATRRGRRPRRPQCSSAQRSGRRFGGDAAANNQQLPETAGERLRSSTCQSLAQVALLCGLRATSLAFSLRAARAPSGALPSSGSGEPGAGSC
ncbi:Protein of unknown function [Gryllus bimaculatus]|nr:Protein of unknown function [Gryllus bimaculatus]